MPNNPPGGLGGVARNLGPNPPYPVGSLHAPLTATQRATLIAWLTIIKGYSVSLLNTSGSMQDDNLLITEYEAVVSGGGLGNAPTQTVGPDLNPWDWVKSTLLNGNLWTRVAEFAVGGILIAVGGNAMLKSGGLKK